MGTEAPPPPPSHPLGRHLAPKPLASTSVAPAGEELIRNLTPTDVWTHPSVCKALGLYAQLPGQGQCLWSLEDQAGGPGHLGSPAAAGPQVWRHQGTWLGLDVSCGSPLAGHGVPRLQAARHWGASPGAVPGAPGLGSCPSSHFFPSCSKSRCQVAAMQRIGVGPAGPREAEPTGGWSYQEEGAWGCPEGPRIGHSVTSQACAPTGWGWRVSGTLLSACPARSHPSSCTTLLWASFPGHCSVLLCALGRTISINSRARGYKAVGQQCHACLPRLF